MADVLARARVPVGSELTGSSGQHLNSSEDLYQSVADGQKLVAISEPTEVSLLDLRERADLIRREWGWSPTELANALGVPETPILFWLAGDALPSEAVQPRLDSLLKLYARLQEVFSGDSITVRQWLYAPSKYLGGLTPVDAIRAGRIDRAEAALEALESGVFI